VTAGRELLGEHLPDLPRLRAIVGDRAYRGLTRLAKRKQVSLDQGAATRPLGVHAHPTLVQDRARFRPARTLAAPVALP
jgi:hypothetical protein